MQEYNRTTASQLTEVSKSEPCIHCGKPDWCYRLGELTVCKRGVEPADGWFRTETADRDGSYFYAPSAPVKPIRPKSKQEFFYPDRDGNPLLKVVRIDDGDGKKSFAQYYWNGKRWLKGCPEEIRPRIPIYRYQQIRKAIAAGRPIFIVEGEGVADALHRIGLAATTTLGGSGKYRAYGGYSDDLKGADIVLCPDRDQPGLKHMEMVAFPNARWLYAPPGDFYWQNLAASGGLDVSDWISDGATKDQILNAINTNKISFSHPCARKKKSIICQDISSNDHLLTVPAADEVFTQKAIDALYSDTNWIAVDKQLYRWIGTHYELVSEAAEKARIARWCNSTPVQNSNRWYYAYAKSSYVDAIWNWMLVAAAVDPALVNPPGLNCLNGVLKIDWHLNVPTWTLVPHDPAVMYTYVGHFEFNPNADATNCDRLLACLDQPQQEIFIKTLAASLDLKTVRLYRGRSIKALLCKGDGNNGKDSLREAVQLLYGFGVISATVSDFQSYDQGRKFTLAKLEGARISWSSENSSVNQLDNLQSLKAAITGEPLDLERKGVDERVMLPSAVFLFNINNVPNLQASLEAIQSRWAVLSFTKTFKANADPNKGEIEADPRFRYDPQFLQREVVPALLNKMLAVLPEVAAKSIDYSCTEAALEVIQEETNHLWAFARQTGLDYQVGGKVYINDLWQRLRDWYIANGTLVVTTDDKGKQKSEWHEQTRRSDRNIKAANQVYQRFIELFPKAKRLRDSSSIDRKGQFYLDGISFISVSEASEAVGEAVGEATARSQSQSEASEAIKGILISISQITNKLKPLEIREALQKIAFEDEGGLIASLASLADTARAVASPTASPLLHSASPKEVQVTDPLQTALAIESPANATGAGSIAFNASISGETNIKAGDNHNNFFGNTHPFKIGSKVAHVDPKRESYNWHGTITEINGDKAKVRWEERLGIRGGQILTHRLSELRLI
jgi:putative DNA primase/helicase